MRNRILFELQRLGLVAMALALNACVVPTPEHALSAGRGEIVPGETMALQPGKTTRKEILLGLGEPSASLEGDTIFVYHWSVVQAYWLYALGNGYTAAADGGLIDSKYLFLTQFDDDGLLLRFERKRVGIVPNLGVAIQELTSAPFFTAQSGAVDRSAPRTAISLESRRRVLIEPAASNPRQRYFIGSKTANTRMAISNITIDRDPNEMVHEALASSWQAAGHDLVVADPELQVIWNVAHLRISTPVELLTWKAVCRLVVDIQIQDVATGQRSAVRTYSTEQVARTVFGPSDKHYGPLVRDGVADIAAQLLQDLSAKEL